MTNDSYELHISAHPKKAPSKFRRGLKWAGEQARILLVSSLIFAVAFLALNWQAISANVQHYMQVQQGFESPLQEVVKEVIEPVRVKLPELTASVLPRYRVPPLDIDVAPPDARIVIPRINQNVPVIGVHNENLIARDWEGLEEDIQEALRNGVVHYPGTSLPGEGGNVVLTGHSSYYAWDPGRFKDVFALLHNVELTDRIVFYYNQKKYLYEVADIRVVKPEEVDVLAPTNDDRLTLITCTPIGTNVKRLIVTAKYLGSS